MMPRTINLRTCPCGGRRLRIRNEQVAEDCVETWVECADCQRTSERVEYPYADAEGAACSWNAGHFDPATAPPALALSSKEEGRP
jgi:hypothetical protein